MRICYIIDNTNISNGGGRYANDLISAVKKSGYETVVIEQKNKWLGGLIMDAIKIRKNIVNCDIIHAIDGYPYAIVAALANIGLNKKLIITLIGTYSVAPLYNFPNSIFLKWAYKKASKLTAISRYTRDEVLKKVFLSNVEIINPGIDFEKFYKEPIKSDEKFILSVGALKYRKGYHISIPAFAEAKKQIPDLKYKIVGNQSDAVYFGQLNKLVIQCGIEKDVEFFSNVSDEQLTDFYRQTKLFILTSVNENHHFEGFGLVFLEAAAAGLPVIGTLGNGIEDAVDNDKNGILVSQNNVSATADAIVKILKNDKLRKRFSDNSVKWAKEHDGKNITIKYLNIYND